MFQIRRILSLHFIATHFILGLMSTSASAQFFDVRGVPNTIDGFCTVDIFASPPEEIALIELLLNANPGEIFQSVAGGNFAPNPAVVVAIPELEFDSYVTFGGFGGPLPQIPVGGGAVNIGGQAVATLNDELIDVAFFPLAPLSVAADIQVARLTLAESLNSDMSLAFVTHSGGFFTSTVQDFVLTSCVPESSSSQVFFPALVLLSSLIVRRPNRSALQLGMTKRQA